MALNLKKCKLCDRPLVGRGFGYYYHPLILDHFGRQQPDERQCSIALDPIGNTFKISKPVKPTPEEIALEVSILSY